MAECHPVAYRFVMEAREKGAKVIHVDPRFTRTSATANLYAPVRSGTDIVFLGAIINYVLQNNLYFKDYVLNYTNASFLLNENFKGPDADELGGLFSGYDPAKHVYDRETWQYDTPGGGTPANHADNPDEGDAHSQQNMSGVRTAPPLQDLTLSDPHSVFQVMKRHFQRYTPEMVERVCGTPKDVFMEVAKTFVENSGPDKTGAFCYAVGFTQHSVGVAMIRAAAILQLLLGNVGRPGGGVMALRGHATIQGSTDIPTLYNLLPGYLQVPMESSKQYTLSKYLEDNYSPTGWWHNMPKYVVSLLKAWYGPNATPENDFGFHFLPKINGDYSYNQIFFNMLDKKIKGLFVMGENFGVGGPNARTEVKAMTKLDWCVVRDLYPVETGEFWNAEGIDPKTVGTEVFLMPAAAVAEKEGSYTNTQRMVQWHEKAVDPPGDARSETWFVYHLGKRLKELYKDSSLSKDKPIQALIWDLPIKEPHIGEPNLEPVAQEISGYFVDGKKPVSGFADLKDDGSTACGAWIYSGIVNAKGENLAASRRADPPGVRSGEPGFTNHSGWGFAWPANRRILYNRASADPAGKPWSDRKKLIWWQPEDELQTLEGSQAEDATTPKIGKGKWVGFDVPDFPLTKAPNTPADPNGKGMAAHSGAAPFILLADGVGQLFVPNGIHDGPLPTHYEAVESPVHNPVYRQQSNPMVKRSEGPENRINPSEDPRFPHIVTTYRLTEHHTSGAMSRWVPWLSELQPELFAEIDPELAAKEGLAIGDWATVTTTRGELEMRVMVTNRMQPLMIDGRKIYQIGLPYHWGSRGLITGDTVNNMTPLVEEPNVKIHEAKTFTANLRKGRRSESAPSEPSSTNDVVVARGGEAGQLAHEVQLGVVDMLKHTNNISADAGHKGQTPAAHEAAGQGRAKNE